MKIWHENDDFWEIMAPKLFTEEHWKRAPEEVEKVIALLEIEPAAHVLDLCCGPGRHSLELARRGFTVTAVDRTLTYLHEAQNQAKLDKLAIEFIQDDMRSFIKSDTFDAIINLYTSFGYFENLEDDKKVLGNIYSSLKSGGKLLIDIIGKEILPRIYHERDWYEKEGTFYLEERQPIDGWERIKNRWIMIRGDEKHEFEIIHRLYSGTELSWLLSEAAFHSIQLFGSFEGTPYDHTAQRLIAIAIK
ncbi:MAG: class I SAM-dependent methyltransferase [Candidatus Helarchaeota archaeon]|nr:class I SAM-dependent methyltransferase [Candidatus Helarchaeota archaeon]